MKKRTTYQPMGLLRRWLQGDARYADEQQLDQQAERDPFLAEALEGLRSRPAGEHAQRVASLRARVRAQSQQKRGRLAYLPRIAAAAAAVVLLGAGLWYFYPRQSSSLEMAQHSDVRAAPGAERMDTPSAAPMQPPTTPSLEAGPKPSAELRPKPPAAPAERTIAPIAPLPSLAERTPAAEADMAIATDDLTARQAPTTAAPAAAASTPPLARLDALPSSPAPPSAASAGARQDTGPELVGRVISEEGEPLIGATVLIPGTNRGAVTDFQGYFRLALQGEQPLPLEVHYTGYAATQLTAQAGDSIEVQLSSAGMVMEEVTVVGRQLKESKRIEAAKAAPAPAPATPAASPAPQGGFRALERHLRRSLQYPPAALENGIEGAVELDFFIAPDGRPTDFKVLRTPGYGCSEEAMRLLREGPPWAPAGQRATYVVEFKR
jgi:TonB family protein